jgi:hypothetical protein
MFQSIDDLPPAIRGSAQALVARGIDPALLLQIISELGVQAAPVLKDITAILDGTATFITFIDLWNRVSPIGADVWNALMSLFTKNHAAAVKALHA